MSDTGVAQPTVAVIGAGPAGLYAAQQLVKQGARVVLFNRDIKPGGLAEYGIYPDKLKMKGGLRAQFQKILALPQVDYFGNVSIGAQGALTLADLQTFGFDAILVTVGAQGTKWLGLPGEHLRGVYHAKEIVYHYNRLPPFSTATFEIGKRAVIVGVGNVMMDVAHWLIRELKIETVTAVARRGPAEIKFDKKEFETVGANVDLAALNAEIARCAPLMRAVDENPDTARKDILAGLPHALPPVSSTRFLFEFLASPRELCGDAQGRVHSIEIEENELVRANGDVKARGLGRTREIVCDTVIFAIGDAVDEHFGLPMARGEFVKNPAPRFPVEGVSYEAFDPNTQQPLEGIFIAGWARQASTGLVGVARKDGTNAANAIGAYLETRTSPSGVDVSMLEQSLKQRGVVVTKTDLGKLAAAERAEAQTRGLPEYKFATNQAMLDAMGLA
jgi:ferredoxin--NADP+ reductase